MFRLSLCDTVIDFFYSCGSQGYSKWPSQRTQPNVVLLSWSQIKHWIENVNTTLLMWDSLGVNKVWSTWNSLSNYIEPTLFYRPKTLIWDFSPFGRVFELCELIMIKYPPRPPDLHHGGGRRVQFHATVACFRRILHCMVVRRNTFGCRFPFLETLETDVHFFQIRRITIQISR